MGAIAYDSYQWTRPTSMTLPGGGTKQFSYDPLMRTKTITASDPVQSPQMSYSYSYDKMDNIKAKDTEAGNYAYGYDALYRLNDVKKDTAQTEAYTYDPVGNRLTSATATNWTYNQNNELQSYNGTTYQYDANGNTTQTNAGGQVQNYVYDGDNRLIEVKNDSGGTVATYAYDPFGRRIKKDVGGAVTYYLYSDEGLIGEYSSTDAEIKIYGYKPNSTWTTDPVFMKENGNYYFYHNDHLGTPQKMTNVSGAVVWSATYDAFGKATVDAGAAVTSNLRFSGQYYDQETGLHYNRARYYDPNVGRFVTKDPIDLAGGDVNLYVYVFNNPINIIDPLGLYGQVVHYHKTYLWALEVGIDPAIAKIIAEADQSVDENFLRPENPFTYIIGTSAYHFPQGTVEQELLSASALGLVESFGRSLHSQQDFFSHRGLSPLKHFIEGNEPDKYCENNPRDQEMERIIKLWLTELKKSLDRRRNRPFR